MRLRYFIVLISIVSLFALALPSQATGEVLTADNVGLLSIMERIETDSAVYSVAWTSDSTSIAYGLETGDIEQMQIVPTLTSLPPLQIGHAGEVTDVDFSFDDQYVFSVSMDGTFNAWERETGNLLSAPGVFLEASGLPFLTSVAAHPNSANLIAYAGQYSDVAQRQWNEVDINPPDLVGHTNFVFDVEYHPTGGFLATAGADNSVRVWEFATGTEIYFEDAHTSRVYDVEFSPDGFSLASAGQDRNVIMRSAFGGSEPWGIATIPDGGRGDTVINAIAFGANNDILFVGDSDGVLRIYRIGSPSGVVETQLLFQTDTGDDQIRDLAVSPDGTMLAIAGFNNTVQIWNFVFEPPAPPPTIVPTESVAPLPVPPAPITGEFCTGAPPSRLEIGQRARVTFTDGTPLRLRTYPGETVTTNMAEGLEFDIIGGPICLDGFTWWQLELDSGVIGWSAEGDFTDYYIEPLLTVLGVPPVAPLDISISGTVWHDICDNDTNATGFCTTDDGDLFIGDGFRASIEPVIEGVTVGMSDGFCPPTGYDYQTTTAIDGTYSFTGLSTGDYCVFINPFFADNNTIMTPGQFTNLDFVDPATATGFQPITITESNLNITDVDFGWDFAIFP